MARISRPLFAVADDVDLRAAHALRDEECCNRIGAAFTEREVVLAGTALVGEAVDRYAAIRGCLRRNAACSSRIASDSGCSVALS